MTNPSLYLKAPRIVTPGATAKQSKGGNFVRVLGVSKVERRGDFPIAHLKVVRFRGNVLLVSIVERILFRLNKNLEFLHFITEGDSRS